MGPTVGIDHSEQGPLGGERGWIVALLASPEAASSREVQGCPESGSGVLCASDGDAWPC